MIFHVKSPSFLQSVIWQKFQESLGKKTVFRKGDSWQYLAVIEKAFLNKRLYLPYGPFAKDQLSFQEALNDLRKQAKKYNVDFIRIEPMNIDFEKTLKQNLFKKVRPIQPELTSIIDLTKSKEQIIANMKQNNRNILRNYHKKGLKIIKSTKPTANDINNLLKLLEKTSKNNNFTAQANDYLKKQVNILSKYNSCAIYSAIFENKTIASALFFISDNGIYYAHASSDYKHRQLSAGNALLAQAIVDAKEMKKDFFDLYGIAPDNSPDNHPWKGFTKFKKSFGGQPVKLIGTWELPVRKIRYLIYKTIFNLVRK